MRKKDVEEIKSKKWDRDPYYVLKERLSKLIGKEVLITSNWERAKGKTRKNIMVYHIGQKFDEKGQALTLENPSLPKEEIPSFLITPSMEILEDKEKITIRYPKELSFRTLRKTTLPDLEIYIEEVKK